MPASKRTPKRRTCHGDRSAQGAAQLLRPGPPLDSQCMPQGTVSRPEFNAEFMGSAQAGLGPRDRSRRMGGQAQGGDDEVGALDAETSNSGAASQVVFLHSARLSPTCGRAIKRRSLWPWDHCICASERALVRTPVSTSDEKRKTTHELMAMTDWGARHGKFDSRV